MLRWTIKRPTDFCAWYWCRPDGHFQDTVIAYVNTYGGVLFIDRDRVEVEDMDKATWAGPIKMPIET